MINPAEQFKKDWAQERDIAQLCVRLFEYLSTSENWLEHFNFSQLKDVSKSSDDIKLSRALQYLSSPRCQILRQIFLYFDDEQVYEFTSSEMVEVYSAAKFAHPRTGQVITDLNQIAVAFEPGRYLHDTVKS